MSNSFQVPAVVGLATVLAAVGVVVYSAIAGPLTPPAGPVTSSYKTLAEVEPRIAINATNTPGDADSVFKITQPGSYYLIGNITGVSGKHGIEIASSGVTLDLNGFDLLGVAGSLDGVGATVAGLTNIAVVDGSVRSWGGDGVDLASVTTSNCRVSGLRATGNGRDGIRIGTDSEAVNCVAGTNAQSGIVTLAGCSIAACTSNGNGTGASAGDGIQAGFACTITACTARANGSGAGGGNGIRAGDGSSVQGCTAYGNGYGSALRNDGISVAAGCSVLNCNATLNRGDGIDVVFQALVQGNNCIANGFSGDGAGIHATGSGNRIESNHCRDADRGIDVDQPGNTVTRNSCAGNTINWTIIANNVCGPILDRTAPASAAISGNSAPSSLGSVDPNANFSY